MRLRSKDFANLFGCGVKDFSGNCRKTINQLNLQYEYPTQQELDKVFVNVLKIIDSPLTQAGVWKKLVWEKGWEENYKDFIQSNYDLSKLIPKFVKQTIMRFPDNYIVPCSPDFETGLVTVLRKYLFNKYFADAPEIYEFGCGTGLNLVALASMFPDKKLYGLDWSVNACKTVNAIAKQYGFKMSGSLFDMFQPDYKLEVKTGSVLFTIGAMEQLGTNFEAFLQFVLDKKFSTMINIETLYELYNPDSLFDYVAMRYMEKRGYLQGYLLRLKQMEVEGKIEILETKKTFGCLYHNGYSFVAWRIK